MDDEVFEILIIEILLSEIVTAGEFSFEAKGVDYCSDTIHYWESVLSELRGQSRDIADSLSDRSWFADTGSFDKDIVEFLELEYFVELLNEVHFEGTAYATVLECHEAFVLFIDDSPLLDKFGIDIDFAYIIYDYGETYTPVIGKYVID